MNNMMAAWLVILPSLAAAQAPPPPQSPASSAPPAGQAAAAPASLALPAATKVVYMEPERLFATSAEGRRLAAGLDAFRQKKVAPLAERNRQLEALRAKRQASASSSQDTLDGLDRDISRLALDLERGSQDAEAEYNDQAAQAQAEFQKKLQPIVQQLLKESGVHVLLTPGAGISWVDPVIDITPELVKRLDAAYPPAPAPPAKR